MFTLATNCFADSLLSSNSDGADGVIGGHEYVDLGLPSGTLWATYNVGATSPYEKGDYFAWGEVEPREDFSWENYKFFERYEVDPNNGEWAVLEISATTSAARNMTRHATSGETAGGYPMNRNAMN